MNIGELARRSGVAIDTIRYYEREGLLPTPPRSACNYRQYGPDQVEQLRLMRRCRSLGMSLNEIRQLLRASDGDLADCAPVNTVIDAHIGHVAQQIKELQALSKQLKALRAHCQTIDNPAACGILAELTQADDGSTSPAMRACNALTAPPSAPPAHPPSAGRAAPAG